MLSLITSCNSFITSAFVPYLKHDVPKRHTCLFNGEDSLISSLEEFGGSPELKLLTHLNAESWANAWLMHISHETTPFFDEHYYRDYLNMLCVSSGYTSKEYFYLGFYPEEMRNIEGPKYIGVFKLLHKQRIFDTVIIIENPYYIDDPSHLINFKYILMHTTDASHIFFKFNGLKRPDQMRYYLAWMHM
jgi:hypothetical protein